MRPFFILKAPFLHPSHLQKSDRLSPFFAPAYNFKRQAIATNVSATPEVADI